MRYSFEKIGRVMVFVLALGFVGCVKKHEQASPPPVVDPDVQLEIKETSNKAIQNVLPSANELDSLGWASQLKVYYQAAITYPESTRFEQLFFETLPNSFNEFDSLYGYSEYPHPLYDEAVDHIINLLPSIKSIDDSTYYTKLIDLGIGGHWEADAVNYLQDLIQLKVIKNPELSFKILSGKSTDEVESFFYFFFNGIHAPYKKIPEEFDRISSLYPESYEALQRGFARGFADSGH